MDVFDKSCSIWAKVFVFGQSGCVRAKLVVLGKVVVFGKVLVFGQSACNPTKVFLFGQKWLCSGKSGDIQAKVVVLGQNLFYSGKVVLFG